jgi:hypothetical protein
MDRFSRDFPREWVKIYMGTIFGDEHLEFTTAILGRTTGYQVPRL